MLAIDKREREYLLRMGVDSLFSGYDKDMFTPGDWRFPSSLVKFYEQAMCWK